jgi:hypothetical protein
MSIKRLTSRRGKLVVPSADALARVAVAAARVGFTREQALAVIDAEPRSATVFAGSLKRSDALKMVSKQTFRTKKIGR